MSIIVFCGSDCLNLKKEYFLLKRYNKFKISKLIPLLRQIVIRKGWYKCFVRCFLKYKAQKISLNNFFQGNLIINLSFVLIKLYVILSGENIPSNENRVLSEIQFVLKAVLS